MSNTYEKFRDEIVAALRETCVTVSEDGSRTSYTWSIDRVFTACGEACKIADTRKLPTEFKEIVRFEFNKLKDAVVNADGYEFRRTTDSYGLSIDGIEAKRNNLYVKTVLPVSEQLKGARLLFDKVGKSMANAKNAEATHRLNKRANRLKKEIKFLMDEEMHQAELVETLNKLNAAPVPTIAEPASK